MKIECCGLSSKETANIIKQKFPEVEVLEDPDSIAARKVKKGEVDFYLGSCMNTSYTEQQVRAWYTAFSSDSKNDLIRAIQRYCTTSRFPPTIADVKKQILILQYPVFELTAETEWACIQKAVQKYGQSQILEAEKSLHSLTLEAVRMIGGLSFICRSSQVLELRFHFIQTFDLLLQKKLHLLSLPKTAMTTKELEDKRRFLDEYSCCSTALTVSTQ